MIRSFVTIKKYGKHVVATLFFLSLAPFVKQTKRETNTNGSTWVMESNPADADVLLVNDYIVRKGENTCRYVHVLLRDKRMSDVTKALSCSTHVNLPSCPKVRLRRQRAKWMDYGMWYFL